MEGREEDIRRRAYEIWEQAGRMGDPEDHWRQAEQELVGQAGGSEATVEALQPEAAVEAAASVGAADGEVAANDAESTGDKAQKRTRSKKAS